MNENCSLTELKFPSQIGIEPRCAAALSMLSPVEKNVGLRDYHGITQIVDSDLSIP
ncbi:hypothetical protein H6G97_27045 [Nostoc flagelliforme FACHB-838]|uniref:Uncharacterized protein n=1 Tax=Nostoc flagelliforme FACHB-838 TaxID=2692904 RepID=A0ABR8DU98_9NOSO|nr:hypothetical protein [Nostoc flagelliforme]MBD2533032.1 hypothetical protein [Nostoc flagelliforme FACHB-838]